MPDDLIGYEAASLTAVEAVLDGLSPATSKEVYLGTRGLDARAIAAVAASRADAGGGGASFPDEWTVGDDGSLFIGAATGGLNNPFQVNDDGHQLITVSQSAITASVGAGATLSIGTDQLKFEANNGDDLLILTPTQLQLSPNNGTVDVMVDTGELRLASNSPIADGDLFNGAFSLWLDTGTSKVMCKAKIGGGIVTGELGTLA